MKHFVNLTGKPVSVGGEDGLSISPSKKVAKVAIKNRVVDRIPLPNGKTIKIVQPVGRVKGLLRASRDKIYIVTPDVYLALPTWRNDVVTAPGIEKGRVREFYQHQPLEVLQLKAAAAQIKNLKAQLQQKKRGRLRRQRAVRAIGPAVGCLTLLVLGAFSSGEGTINNKAARIEPPVVQRTMGYQKPTLQVTEQLARQTRMLPYTYSGNIQSGEGRKAEETKKEERKTRKQKRLSRQSDKIMTMRLF